MSRKRKQLVDPLPKTLEQASADCATLSIDAIRLTLQKLQSKIETLRHEKIELKKTHALYRELYDLAPTGYLILNESGSIQQANATAADLLGSKSGTLIQQPIARFIHWADQARYFQHSSADSNTPQRCELRMVKQDGSFFWAHWEFATHSSGGAPQTRIVFHNITSQEQSRQSLQESEEFYRLIVQTAQEGIWRIDTASLTDYVNPKMAEMMGYAPEEMLGRPIDDFLDDEGRALLAGHIKRRKGGVAEQFEFTYLRKDGSKLVAFVTTNPITNSQGEYTGAVAMLTDISNRRAAEAAWRESDERFRTLFENAGDGIVILEGDRFVDCNARSLEIFGCSNRNEFVNRPPYHFSPSHQPNGRESAEFAIEKITAAVAGTPQFFEWIHTKLDGTPFPTEITLNKVESGGKVLLQAIVRDITERRQTELALNASLEFTNSLINSMLDGFAVVDATGVQVAVNPAFCRMTGFLPEELVGRSPPFPYWPPEDYEKIHMAFVETVKGNFSDFELKFQRKSGERFPVIVSPSTVKSRDGKTMNFLATVKDITTRKEAETILTHTAEMLERTGAVAKIGGWELDLKSVKIFWSLQTCHLFEVDSSYAPSLEQAIAFYAPEEQTKIAAAVQAAIDQGTPFDLELRVISAKGRHFWARAMGAPMFDEGKTVKLTGTFQDITERKEAEIKYLQELKFNETLVDHTSVIIVLLDRQGRMVHVNQATVDILGYTREELVGQTPWAIGIMSPEEKVRAVERLQLLLKGGANPPRETILTGKNGEDHLFSLSSISTRSTDGTIDRIIVTGADLTERTRLQKELLNISEQEQARIGHNLHDGVGQTLTGVASLMAALEFELDGEQRCSAARIREVINDAIQEVRRMSHGLSPSAVKNRGLEGALQLLTDTIQINHRTTCELSMEPGIHLGDLEKEAHIYRITQEACNNAIRHGKPTKITISLRHLGSRECVLKIENDGSRISRKAGVGIGLQIMDYRANLIGGTLKITSKSKNGVSVVCRFPCTPIPTKTR